MAGATAIPALPLEYVLDEVAGAGFQGVEAITTPKTDLNRLEKLTDERNLELRLHECWSVKNGSSHLFNWVAGALGVIPWNTDHMDTQVRLPLEVGQRFIAYAHRILTSEYTDLADRNLDKGILFQTCQVSDRYIGIAEFIEKLERLRNGDISMSQEPRRYVAFDTMQYLEWCTGGIGVSRLSGYRDADISQMLLEGFHSLHKHTEEIHLCDAIPDIGNGHGRNVMLDTGKLPLRAFGQFCRNLGWKGYVTPEIHPHHLFHQPLPVVGFGTRFRPKMKLDEVLNRTREIMEG